MTRSFPWGTTLVAAAALVMAAAFIATTTRAETTLMAPTNLTPTNGATLTSAQFTIADWTDVSSTSTGTSTVVNYNFESSLSSTTDSDGSFTLPLFESGTLSSSSISTSGTGEGTYFWHARAIDTLGSTSPWSATFTVIVDNDATSTPTTTPPGGTGTTTQALIDELKDLQDEFPQFFWQLQWLINDLADDGGTTTPPTSGSASIDNNGTTVQAGGHLDFVGRNFGHEETVNITLNSVLIRTAHADGGGNFSTGSMSAPTTPGTYTYVFTGATSGRTANSVITVQ